LAFSKLRSRLLGLFALWALLLCGLGALTASRLQSMTGALESVYVDRLLCQVQLRLIGEVYGTRIPAIVGRWREAAIDGPTAVAQLSAAQQEAAQNWLRYKASDETAAEKVLIPRTEPVLAHADATATEARRLIAAGDAAAVEVWARMDAPDAFTPMVAMVDQLFALQGPAAALDVQQARHAYYGTLTGMLLLIGFAFVAGGAAAWALVSHYTGVARETDRALRRMGAFYSALSRTNHLIVRAPDAATLLSEVCGICTETDHALIATVHLLDGPQALRHAVAGPEADLFGELPMVWRVDDAAYRSSVTALALSSGRAQVGVLRPADGAPQAWQDSALRRNIRAVAAFPLHRDERVHGALTLYSAEAGFFDAAMMRLLSQMAGDLSYALDHLDREADGVLEQVQMREALEGLQTLFLSSPVACVISTLDDARVLEVNDAMAATYGLHRGRPGMLPIHGDADALAYRERLLRDGQVRNMEVQARLPDGRLATVILNAETLEYQGQTCVMAMVVDVSDLRAEADAREKSTSV
jgi:PAS domain S-box-containing protein